MKNLEHKKFNNLPRGSVLKCTNAGVVHIVSGDSARSADVRVGDKFIIDGFQSSPYFYYGRLEIKGTWKRDPGLSGADVRSLSKRPIDHDNIVYAISKSNVNTNHVDDFFATFKTVQNESLKESKNSNTPANMDDLAYEFITTVLKLGTRDNLFDKFLEKKKESRHRLYDLMEAVNTRIKTHWL